MSNDIPVTEVQRRAARSATRRNIFFYAYAFAMLLGFIATGILAIGTYYYFQLYGQSYRHDLTHFKYGSIGAELENGLPYRLFVALPEVFPEYFDEKYPYSRYGFIYEPANSDADGGGAPDPRLPIGFAKGYRQGVEVTWFNCAVCHTGKVRHPGSDKEEIVPGMPANTVDLELFFLSLFEMAVDKRFSWNNRKLREAVGQREMNLLQVLVWEWVVIPNTRATLIRRRSELLLLLDPDRVRSVSGKKTNCLSLQRPSNCPAGTPYERPPQEVDYESTNPTILSDKFTPTRWGIGRVDTFNPYKMIHFGIDAECLSEKERTGVADFPSIFGQRPRGERAMHLHWDGNNASLAERNLSAALGAGVTERTADHASIQRVAGWLRDGLKPPENPYLTLVQKDAAAVERGRAIYMVYCATCHGYQGKDGYVYEGARLGQIEPIEYIGTDPARLDSYTVEMEHYQKDRLFCGSPQYRFRNFKKTNGYANMPLDALWLRAPYLHNGSVPTLSDLLKPPSQRPVTFRRDITELDPVKGGFVAPSCEPNRDNPGAELGKRTVCFNTGKTGNHNVGHTYGTTLAETEKQDLLKYLLTF